VAGGELDGDLARTYFEDIGRVIGLSDADVRRQVANGMRKGATKPRAAVKDGRRLKGRNDAIAAVITWWCTDHRHRCAAGTHLLDKGIHLVDAGVLTSMICTNPVMTGLRSSPPGHPGLLTQKSVPH